MSIVYHKVETFSNFVIRRVKMLVYERQREILNYLKRKQFATISDLAKIVWSSESSVRRDVKALEQKGYVKQIYGGVVLPEYEHSVMPISLRDPAHSSVKEDLARRAAEQLFDGATVMMDGSSTVRRITKYIGNFKNLKIITNNQRIFSTCDSPEVRLYCTGGLYIPQSHIFVGSVAESYVNNINADILFFSSQAISDGGEISDSSEEETALRRAMLARAKKKVFLCDSSKLGLSRTFTLCTKDDVDMIICDKELPWEKK